MIYLVYATNYGLFQLKVSNIYALHKNHHTDPPCLLFSGMLLMRMSVPIAYNFLQLTRVDSAAIFIVMGPVKYVSFLGEDFNRWVFPICLALMVVMTIFNVYGRVLGCLGLKQYQFDQDCQEELEEDGRYIIEQFKSEVLLQTGEHTSLKVSVESDYRTSSIGFERLSLKGAKIEISGKAINEEGDESLIVKERNSTGYSSRDSVQL